MELIWQPSCRQLWAQKSDKLLKVHLAVACEERDGLLRLVFITVLAALMKAEWFVCLTVHVQPLDDDFQLHLVWHVTQGAHGHSQLLL